MGVFSKKTFEERFWAKVAKTEDCWEWQAALTPAGYGVINKAGQTTYAHRQSYEWAHGALPAGLFVCHTCDNPRCINPAHLFPGTAGDNARDMSAKGRTLNQRKTHCPRGHAYDDQNTRILSGNRRECKQCVNIRWNECRARKEAQPAV